VIMMLVLFDVLVHMMLRAVLCFVLSRRALFFGRKLILKWHTINIVVGFNRIHQIQLAVWGIT